VGGLGSWTLGSSCRVVAARQAGSKVRPARAPPPPFLRTCASRHGAGAERTVGRESRTARRKKARHKDHTKRAQVIEPICAAPPPRLVPVPGLLVLAKETVHVPSPNTDVMCMPSSPLVSCQRVGSSRLGFIERAWRYGWMVHHETARHRTQSPGYPTNYSADSVISRVRNERHRGGAQCQSAPDHARNPPFVGRRTRASTPRATCCACMQTLLPPLLLQGFWLMYRAVYSCLLFWGRALRFCPPLVLLTGSKVALLFVAARRPNVCGGRRIKLAGPADTFEHAFLADAYKHELVRKRAEYYYTLALYEYSSRVHARSSLTTLVEPVWSIF
jgi:hypothetical protein